MLDTSSLFNDVCTDLEDVVSFVKVTVPDMSDAVKELNRKTYPNLKGLEVCLCN